MSNQSNQNNWYQAKIKYQKVNEATGKDQTIKESYLTDGVSFTEVEARVYKVLEDELGIEFIVTNITPVNFHDIFHNEDGEIWYKCKVVYIDADPSNGKEKKTGTYALTYANSIKDACEKLEKELSEVLIPWEVKSIAETNIFDVFPYNAGEAEAMKLEAEGFVKVEKTEREKLAELLNRRQQGNEITISESVTADQSGLVVVFGENDDSMHFHGALNNEINCEDGGYISFSKNDEYNCYNGSFPNEIKALWCPIDEEGNSLYSWTYETDIPHSAFDIMEEDGFYCKGIVFSVDDLK